jgi:serine/threonine-protein kinase
VIGRVLASRYRIVRLLGQGGMGAVYEADDLAQGGRVAVKVITGDLARSEALVQRFEHERLAASAIDSAHIARLLDAGTDGDAPFIVMEYLRGEDLGELFARLGLVGESLALRLVAQACLGLASAHAAGVVHRDVKPANLYLAEAEGGARVVKLLDFGVAKVKLDWATSVEAGGITRTGTMLGSPLYMAPEQARGRAVDARADLWSLGVVLYRALAGNPPHAEVEGLGDLIIKLCTAPPPPIQRVAPWVSAPVAALLGRLLSLDAPARYPSAEELLDVIRPLVGGRFTLTAEDLVPLSPEERARAPVSLANTRLESSGGPRLSLGATPGAGRILVVEDNEMNMDMIARRLERKGFEVLRALDGEEGVAMATAALPDLVLMDVSLPGMDGWTATRTLRAAAATSKLPIIALTAHALASDREKAIEVGCDDYETKPVDFPRLLGKIQNLLGKRA